MFLVAIALITLWSNQALTGQSDQQPPLELTAAADVSAARGVDGALHALSEKVTSCVTGGRAPEACRCAYPKELTDLRVAYEKTIKAHPAWTERALSYRYQDKDGQPLSGLLVMPTLRRQLDRMTCE